MAIEFCPRDSSPRMSFSGDVPAPVERQEIRSVSPASPEFNFCVFRETCESSSADELFSDGKILPIEIKRKMGPQKKLLPPPPPTPLPPPGKQSWTPRKLGRSWSLRCGKGNLCPLPILSRSNSTGTSFSPINRPNYMKVSSSSSTTGHHHHHQKPPLKKLTNNSGIGVNPVLNILPPARFFCLSSIFSGGKDKRGWSTSMGKLHGFQPSK